MIIDRNHMIIVEIKIEISHECSVLPFLLIWTVRMPFTLKQNLKDFILDEINK